MDDKAMSNQRQRVGKREHSDLCNKGMGVPCLCFQEPKPISQDAARKLLEAARDFIQALRVNPYASHAKLEEAITAAEGGE